MLGCSELLTELGTVLFGCSATGCGGEGEEDGEGDGAGDGDGNRAGDGEGDDSGALDCGALDWCAFDGGALDDSALDGGGPFDNCLRDLYRRCGKSAASIIMSPVSTLFLK